MSLSGDTSGPFYGNSTLVGADAEAGTLATYSSRSCAGRFGVSQMVATRQQGMTGNHFSKLTQKDLLWPAKQLPSRQLVYSLKATGRSSLLHSASLRGVTESALVSCVKLTGLISSFQQGTQTLLFGGGITRTRTTISLVNGACMQFKWLHCMSAARSQPC